MSEVNSNNMPLTIEQQIEILESLDPEETKYFGLCGSMIKAFEERHGKKKDFLADYIPIFTRENALQFGASPAKYSLWWKLDDPRRSLFLNWMINQLKKQPE